MHRVMGAHHNLNKGAPASPGRPAHRYRWLSVAAAVIAVPVIALATTAYTPPRPAAQIRTVVRGDGVPDPVVPAEPAPETVAVTADPPLRGFLLDLAVRLSLTLIALLVLLRFAAWLQVALRWLAGATVAGLVVVLAAFVLIRVG